MWYFIESSLITAWWNVVSTKHLRKHLPRWHILHTSNEWADSGASFDREQMNSEKIVFFGCLRRKSPCACLLFAAPKHLFVHNLPARHMLLTISRSRPSLSMCHSMLWRSWMTDTLESGEGILLGICWGHSESVRSYKGERLSQFQLCDLARKRGQAGRAHSILLEGVNPSLSSWT